MTEIIISLICLVPLILGLSELLHCIKLHLLKPSKPMITYKLIFLRNENCVEHLTYAKEQYLWNGKRDALNLVVIYSALNEENLAVCGEIAQKYGFIFCSVQELKNF